MGIRSILFAGFTLVAAAQGSAQMRVAVDGQIQDVPPGIVRTITYAPDGRQIVRDTPFAGQAAPYSATVTTTETTDEDSDGNMIQTAIVTRIEPIIAAAWASQPVVYAPPQELSSAPSLRFDVDPDALAVADPTGTDPKSLTVARDPMTGHFVATIRINGVAIRAIVDTGAQTTILSARDARATGADHDITRLEPMAGIGGFTELAVTHIHSMEVAGQELGDFNAAIGAEGIPYTLLGQTEIARLGRIVIENGVMTIAARGVQMAAR